jgi:hypothetical protein
VRVGGAQVTYQLSAVPVGEVQIHDRQVHAVEHAPRLGERSGLRRYHELGLPGKHEGERLAEGRMVVDKQDIVHRPALNSKPNTEPPPGSGSNVSSLPWDCKMRRDK